MPSSWSNNFNSNETKETSPQHSGWLDCFSHSVSRDPRLKCLNQAQQLFRKVPTSVPLQVLASAPGAVIVTIKPVARTCWDSRTSRTLPSGNPGLRYHWRPSWDELRQAVGAVPEQGASIWGYSSTQTREAPGAQDCQEWESGAWARTTQRTWGRKERGRSQPFIRKTGRIWQQSGPLRSNLDKYRI